MKPCNYYRIRRCQRSWNCFSDFNVHCFVGCCLFAAVFHSVILDAANAAPPHPFPKGCLYGNKKVSQIRVCNSEDAVGSPDCRPPPFADEYMEIRIHAQDWDSSLFESWILQVLLSELLEVPTTIESGSANGQLNLYHPDAPLIYGTQDKDEPDLALLNAFKWKDCRDLAAQRNASSTVQEKYQPCAHIIPERWKGMLLSALRASNESFQIYPRIYSGDTCTQRLKLFSSLAHFSLHTGVQSGASLREWVYLGQIAPPQTLGVLGQEAWFITKFTVEQDPSLALFLGLQGEEKRQYLADTFLRPTSWHDYCTQVDPFNCSLPTNISLRAPETDAERLQFYNWPNYIGHFRKTEENDCDLNPTNCTGHIADFPCHWDSFVAPQLYYLNIALKSSGPEGPAGGYPYARLVEMWKAANATRSNLIMYYWTPEALYQEFAGTDAEFIRVSMPPPSQKCQEARRLETDQCSPDFKKRIGSPDGICEESAKNLYKLIVGNLYEMDRVEESIRSPAYEALQLFQMTELQLGQIFDFQREEPTPRHAVCRWIVKNLETLETFVPRTYPRLLRDESKSRDAFSTTALVLSLVATATVVCTIYAVVRHRNLRAIRLAQIEFLYFLLAGLLLVAVGAVLVALGGKCGAVIWFINFGYTLELVPLIVKVAAVNQLLGAARQFRRVVISRKSLFSAVFGISFCVFIFLLLWTILDPPQQNPEYSLTDDVTQDGHTAVDVTYYCSSDSLVWDYVAVGWNTLLLLCATVLAFQTRTLQKDFNESQTLAFLIYSHFIFVVLRLITVWLQVTSNGLRSLIFSIDTLATILIYFVPKFSAAANKPQDRSSSFFLPDQSSRGHAAAAVTSQQSDAAAVERHVAFREKSTSSSATPQHRNQSEGYLPQHSEASSSHQGGMSSTHLSTSDDDVRIPEEEEHVNSIRNDANYYVTGAQVDEEDGTLRDDEGAPEQKEVLAMGGDDESSEVFPDDIVAMTSSLRMPVK